MLSVNKTVRFLKKNNNCIRLMLFIVYCFFIIYYTLLCREIGDKHRTELRFMWAYREMLNGNPKWRGYVWQNICNVLFFIPFGLLFPKVFIRLSVFKYKQWFAVLVSGMIFSIVYFFQSP